MSGDRTITGNHKHRRSAYEIAVIACYVSVGWNAVRLPGNLTLGDAALTIAAALALSHLGRTPDFSPAIPGILLVGFALAAAGAGLAIESPQEVVQILTFIASAVVPVIAVSAINLGRLASLACHSFLVGSTVSAVVGVLGSSTVGRLQGLSDHPNTAAFAMCLGVIAGLHLMSDLRVVSSRRFAVLALATAVTTYGAFRTGSRLVPLALAAVFALHFVRQGSRRAIMAAYAALLTAPLWWTFFASTEALRRLVAPDSYVGSSNDERSLLANTAWNSIADSPWVGRGIEYMRRAHSAPLGMWDAAGFLGAVGALIFFVGLGRLVIRGWHHRSPTVLIVAGPSVIATFMLLQTNVDDRFVWIWLATLSRLAYEQPLSDRLDTKERSYGRSASIPSS